MEQYYCIKCKELHEREETSTIFTSGFHTFPNGIKYPLGLCQKEHAVQ
ncbi:DUF3973 domain-containing protein [Brevibacillus sp. H7]